MLIGHGRYHELVPTDPLENLRFRLALLDECQRSARARYLIWHACANDILFFINTFGWQTNPELFGEEDGPFICFPFQAKAILTTIEKLLYERLLVLWEKSRKQGGTVLALFLLTWITLFHRRKRALAMSHNEKAVEKGNDEDTLFGKIDFVLTKLPSWMQDGLPRVKGVYKLQKTRSQIVGTSTTVRSGVGGRTTLTLGDEISKWMKAEEILRQLRDTGPILAIGTHYGVGGTFFDLCNDPLVFKIVFHWSLNPMYNKGLYRSNPELKPHERVIDKQNPPPPDYPFVTDGSPHGGPYPGVRSIYYDQLCRDRSARDMAIHWDIDPAGASRQFFNTNMIREHLRRYARTPDWQGNIDKDPAGRFIRLIEYENGPLKLWFRPLDTEKRIIAPSIFRIGCDTCAGTGATPACASIVDAMTGRKVGEYMYSLAPDAEPPSFARTAIALCHAFPDATGTPAKLIWDATGPTGAKFGEAIVQCGFRHFWYWKDENPINPKVSDKPGWFANPNSTMSLFRDYNEALEKKQFLNPSETALKDTLAFEYTDGGNGIAHGASIRTDDPSAGRTNHSDMAYADALAWKLCIEVGGRKSPQERLELNSEVSYQPYSLGWLMRRDDSRMAVDRFRR